MALYDPEAAGNAAQYLRLDPVALMEVRSAPFDGKTSVWIPYSETGYTQGTLISESEGKKVVKRDVDGKEKEFKEAEGRLD